MAEGIFWDGSTFYEPGIKTRIDKSGMNSTSLSGDATLVLIGDANAGQPFLLKKLDGTSHAKEYLQDGALLQAYIFATAPSPSMPPAQEVAVMNVRNITQASAYLNLNENTSKYKDLLSSDPDRYYANMVKVDSSIWGTTGNNIQLRWDTSDDDEERRYIYLKTQEDGETEAIDIKREVLSITRNSESSNINICQIANNTATVPSLNTNHDENLKFNFNYDNDADKLTITIIYGSFLLKTSTPTSTPLSLKADLKVKFQKLTYTLSNNTPSFVVTDEILNLTTSSTFENYIFNDSYLIPSLSGLGTDANEYYLNPATPANVMVIEIEEASTRTRQYIVNTIETGIKKIYENLDNIYSAIYDYNNVKWGTATTNTNQFTSSEINIDVFKTWFQEAFGVAGTNSNIPLLVTISTPNLSGTETIFVTTEGEDFNETISSGLVETILFSRSSSAKPAYTVDVSNTKIEIDEFGISIEYKDCRYLDDLITKLNESTTQLIFTKHHQISGKSKLNKLLDIAKIEREQGSNDKVQLYANTAELITVLNNNFGNIVTLRRFSYLTEISEEDRLSWAWPSGSVNPDKIQLSGATSTNPDIDEWSQAFETLETEKVDTIVAVTSLMSDMIEGRGGEYSSDFNDAIHALGKAHVVAMAATKKGKRRRYVASTVNPSTNNITTTDFDKITAAYSCNRVLLCGYGIIDYDYKFGEKRLFHPCFTSVKLASMICGSSPQCSMTSQSISGVSPEGIRDSNGQFRSLGQTEKEDLLKASVVVPVLEDGRLFILRSMSTWRQDGNYYDVEPSVLRCADFSQNDAEYKMNQHRITWAGNGYSPVAADIVIAVQTILEGHRRAGWIVNTDLGSAFSNITASIEGDVFYWDVDLRLPIPKNFGFGTAYLVK